jgi:hypothetical protein
VNQAAGDLDFTSGNLKFQSITTDDVQVRVYETRLWRLAAQQ